MTWFGLARTCLGAMRTRAGMEMLVSPEHQCARLKRLIGISFARSNFQDKCKDLRNFLLLIVFGNTSLEDISRENRKKLKKKSELSVYR